LEVFLREVVRAVREDFLARWAYFFMSERPLFLSFADLLSEKRFELGNSIGSAKERNGIIGKFRSKQ
jgi:hypothetical protein